MRIFLTILFSMYFIIIAYIGFSIIDYSWNHTPTIVCVPEKKSVENIIDDNSILFETEAKKNSMSILKEWFLSIYFCRMQSCYYKQIHNAVKIFETLNHTDDNLRISARYQLATIQLSGPLSFVVYPYLDILLPRFFNFSGKLIETEVDMAIDNERLYVLMCMHKALETRETISPGAICTLHNKPLQQAIIRTYAEII